MFYLQLQDLSQTLELIRIEGCHVVESLIEALRKNQASCLQNLDICDCFSAIKFPAECLPSALATLKIERKWGGFRISNASFTREMP